MFVSRIMKYICHSPLIKKLCGIKSQSFAEKLDTYWEVIQEIQLGGPFAKIGPK